MATENSETPAAPETPVRKLPERLVVISHSSMFYWWPVWVVAFLMGIISLFGQNRIAVVPSGTKLGVLLTKDAEVKLKDGKKDAKPIQIDADRPVYLTPKGTKLDRLEQPGVTVSNSSKPGVFFAIALLLVITITNIRMPGIWSLVVIVLIVALIVILALFNAWELILGQFRDLDIRISTGGYFFIAGVLFIIWNVVFWVFDRQRFMVFTPGNFTVRLEIGEGAAMYDTWGMMVKKERSDFFRHWILGLGSGDMIINTTGAHAHQFDLPNVLNVGRKARMIEEMVRTRKEIEQR